MRLLTQLLSIGLALGICHADDIQPLVHALQLKQDADTRVGECKLADARSLYMEAGRLLTATPPDNEPDGAGRGKVQADIDVRLAELDIHERAAAAGHKKAEELLQQGQLASATEVWNNYSGQACDAAMGEKLTAARARAQMLVDQGDVEVNPKRRLAIYNDAFHLNSQIPGLYQKLSATRQQVQNLPCNACRVTGKVVKRVLILGAIGVGGYFGWQEYQKYQKTHSNSASPCTGATCR